MQSLGWPEFWSEFFSDYGLSFLLQGQKHWGRGRRMSIDAIKTFISCYSLSPGSNRTPPDPGTDFKPREGFRRVFEGAFKNTSKTFKTFQKPFRDPFRDPFKNSSEILLGSGGSVAGMKVLILQANRYKLSHHRDNLVLQTLLPLTAFKKRPEPQICPKFVPAIVSWVPSQGVENLSKFI